MFRAEDRESEDPDCSAGCRFNGAALVQSGRPTQPEPTAATPAASMGPLLFRAEDLARSQRATRGPPSFNGAALVQSGRHQLRPEWHEYHLSFNGAALVQSGRPVIESAANAPTVIASMGPLLFRAEDEKLETAVGRLESLQWGRSCSERKTRLSLAISCPHLLEASMGPLLFRAEDTVDRDRDKDLIPASMGPLLFRAEDALMFVRWLFSDSLQWGRSCSERKTRNTILGRWPALSSFNGAALVQSGRPR